MVWLGERFCLPMIERGLLSGRSHLRIRNATQPIGQESR